MRTTIDIPASVRQRLVQEAARRNLKGFSSIIVEALDRYFQDSENDNTEATLRELMGSMDQAEYEESVALLKEGRSKWKT